jgi:two-component system, cell cycle sensor histidine kinase and response regulator CckA
MVYEADAPAFAVAWSNAAQSGVAVETESRLKRRDGILRWHLLRAIPERNDEQAIVNWVGTCTDIDNQKRTEEAIRQQQKWDSIGLLAGGIAHDFNNLLTGMMAGTSLAKEMLAEDHAVQPILDLVLRSSDRAALLTRQMLAYAGKSSELTEHVNMRHLIAEACDLVRASFTKSISVECMVDSDLPLIEANPNHMRQLVMNLLINAAEAIGDAPGRIAISSRLCVIDASYDCANVLAYPITPGTHVLLEITDSGCGMDEETRANAFEPFFTTKFTGRGLGLAAVYGIVRTLHGTIELTSTPGQGTTFRIHVPALIAHRHGPMMPKTIRPGRTGRILLIDDEEGVRAVGKMILERAGHTVVLAHDGASGVSMFRLHKDRLDLVLLDMNMPDLSGAQVLIEIGKISTAVPVAIVSGYSEQTATAHFHGVNLAGFIQKPFAGSSLTDQVARLLEGSP